jgi:hypothetical protein
LEITGIGGLQTEQNTGDIHRGRTGIMPEAIKHYCEHVFQHWRLQGLVDLQTEQKREDILYIEEEQASRLKP